MSDVLEVLMSEAGLNAREFCLAQDGHEYRGRHEKLLRHEYVEVGITGVSLFLVEDIRLIGLQDRRTLEAAICAGRTR